MERRAGIEPANTGFADPPGASQNFSFNQIQIALILVSKNTKAHQPSGGWVIGVSVLIFSELVPSTRPPRAALTAAETHREREERTHRIPIHRLSGLWKGQCDDDHILPAIAAAFP